MKMVRIPLSSDRGGIDEFWRVRLETIKRRASVTVLAAKYHARLRETDEALRALRGANEKRGFSFPDFYSDPVFINCRTPDPRFHELFSLRCTAEAVAIRIARGDRSRDANRRREPLVSSGPKLAANTVSADNCCPIQQGRDEKQRHPDIRLRTILSSRAVLK